MNRSADRAGEKCEESLGELDEHQLTQLFEALQREKRSVEARLCAVVAELERRETFLKDGASSMAQWVASSMALTAPHAKEMAEVSRRLSGLPALSKAFETGQLSMDQVRPLTLVADPETEAELASQAVYWSPSECRRLARRYQVARDPVKPSNEPASEESSANWDPSMRFFRISQQQDGSYRLSGRLAEEAGTSVSVALSHLASEAPPDPSTGLYDPWEKRMADALVELVTAGAQSREPARPVLMVHIDKDALCSKPPARGVDLEGGPMGTVSLESEAGRRLACDSLWQAVIKDASGEPVALGKMSRSAPVFMRALLRRRDGKCRFPGCTNTRFLHAHHIVHWADGGKTELSNLVFICTHHHRFLHDCHWELEGSPSDELVFVSPEGRRLVSKALPQQVPKQRSDLELDTG
jgi:hypothetical protein